MSRVFSRIDLAVEAPLCLLPQTDPYTDFDFALAHRVLEDPAYAAHFRNRRSYRELILDNSFHELRHPVSISELLDAAELTEATYIIAPDKSYESAWSIEQYQELVRRRDSRHFVRDPTKARRPSLYKIGVVLSAHTSAERAAFLAATAGAAMLCLPYNQPRFAWYTEHFPAFQRIHLLGASEPAELFAWQQYTQCCHISVDTSKPVKHGLLGKKLSELRSWRHPTVSSTALLTLNPEDRIGGPDGLDLAESLPFVTENLYYLRGLLG